MKHYNEITLKDFSDIEHKEKLIDFRTKLFNFFAQLSWVWSRSHLKVIFLLGPFQKLTFSDSPWRFIFNC